MRTKKNSPQVKLDKNTEFERFIATFRRISAIYDPIERDFELGCSARNHLIPRQEIRRIYREWAISGVGGQR
jgi:hypothetical protein